MDHYVYIQWPESQDYMEHDWFKEEAILDNSENATSSSYLIPENRYMEELAKNHVTVGTGKTLKQLLDKNATGDEIHPIHSYIQQRIKELADQYPTTKEDEDAIDKEWEAEDGFESFMGGMSVSEAIIQIKLTEL